MGASPDIEQRCHLIEALRILICASSFLLLVPTLVFFAEVLLASLGNIDRKAERESRRVGSRPRLAVLVPAHDEASGIVDTLRSLRPQLQSSDRLLVVADNCTDETAALAAAEGAEVLIRHDLERRGKGFALDAGVRHLAADPPAVLVIVDADCRLQAGALELLARCCSETHRPVQALYLMRSPHLAAPLTKVAEFAWIVKNLVRPLGLRRLGLPCQLMGTGMAFPWEGISRAHLGTANIVEDVQLGIEFAVAGSPPIFLPETCVLSTFPSTARGLSTQHTRWEHGHLAIALCTAPRLLLQGVLNRRPILAALALDLCIPPLALLLLATLALWILSIAMYRQPGEGLPAVLGSAPLTLLAVSVLLAWARYGRQTIPLKHLVLALLYAAWKVPLYVRFALGRQVEWIRSKRD